MAKTMSPSYVTFKVNRFPPELIVPAKPTPHEFKLLSDLDSCIRLQVPGVLIYPRNRSMNGVDLVKLIKNAISRALVYYYPFAGRLREDPNSGKLVVECTGEGVLFIEADADVTLDQFGYPLAPPFMSYQELVFNVPGSSNILNSPLILMQMTRLKCGGLIIGVRLNHCTCDAVGIAQFMSAVAEMAKGTTSLSVIPTWERHILNSNYPQLVRSSVPENKYDDLFDSKNLCYRTFFFGKTEIGALRKHIPHSFKRCSSFKILMSCVWKCRVLALASHPTREETVSLIWPIDLRQKKNARLRLPAGYYGNALVFSVVKSSEQEIVCNPLSYTLQLVTNCNKIVSQDFDRSVMNLTTMVKNYVVTDQRFSGVEKLDFGWGKPEYGGPPHCPSNVGYHLTFKSKNGENEIMLPLCLPAKSMQIFEQELNNIIKGDSVVAKSKL